MSDLEDEFNVSPVGASEVGGWKNIWRQPKRRPTREEKRATRAALERDRRAECKRRGECVRCELPAFKGSYCADHYAKALAANKASRERRKGRR